MAALFIAQATNTPLTLGQQLDAARRAAADVQGRGRRHRQRLHRPGGDALGGRPRAGRGPGADPRHRPLHVRGARAHQPDRQRRRDGRGREVDRRPRHRAACAASSTARPPRRPTSPKRCSTGAACAIGAVERVTDPGRGTLIRRDRRRDGTMSSPAAPHRIVIVGGGAGGLELATRLGNKLGRRGQADVTLIDETRTHVWKPRCTRSPPAAWTWRARGRLPRAGALAPLPLPHRRDDRARSRAPRGARRAATSTTRAARSRRERAFGYDTLVIAIGSQSNDFGTPGVREHAMTLESPADARASTRAWSTPASARTRRPTPLRPEQLHVAIIGAGATGVELAAELHRTTREVVAYGLDRVDADKDIQVTLIEAADRVLPALPRAPVAGDRGAAAQSSASRCTPAPRWPRCCADGVRLADGRILPAELVVWAAGVKAPDFLKDLAGLETNRINQLVVRPTLQTTRDDDIFAHRRLRGLRLARPTTATSCRRARRPRTSRPRTWRADQAAPGGQAAAGLPLPRLRLAGVARRVQHGRQHDGRPDRRQPDDRGRFRAPDVPVALQDARAARCTASSRSRSTRWRALITRRTEPHVKLH